MVYQGMLHWCKIPYSAGVKGFAALTRRPRRAGCTGGCGFQMPVILPFRAGVGDVSGTHSEASPGGSYWMMWVTAGKSRPRAATSVHSSTPAVQREKSRKVCVRTPYHPVCHSMSFI